MNEPLMIRFINKITGTEMWVPSDRVEEYKAAGHKLAADLGTRPKAPKPVKVEVEERVEEPAVAEEEPKRGRRRK